MEHILLLRKQAHELKMRQMVEEINLGRLTIDQARAKYNLLTRHTVRKWLERVSKETKQRAQAMEQTDRRVPTIVEQVAHKADELAQRVKQLEAQLEQSNLQVLYYSTVIRVAEQELGIAIEKKSVTKQSNSCE